MRHILICAATALALSACGEDAAPPPPAPSPAGEAMDGRMASAPQMAAVRQRAEESPAPDAPEQGLYLAYAYSYALRLPASSLADIHAGHVRLCEEAGPATCRVISAQLSGRDGSNPHGVLDLRAHPDWIARFREDLPGELGEAGGSIQSEEARMEDLTAQIVDGEARLRARTALRDRLQRLLETGGASVEELVAVERELARVQSDLESRESVLAALRERVETSRLTIQYRAQPSVTAQSNFAPITDALETFTHDFSQAVAAMIRFVAGFLPWLVVIVPALLLIRLWIRGFFRRRREKRAEASADT
jgi:hypothetical protein